MKKLITALGLVAVVAILTIVVMARFFPAAEEISGLGGEGSPYPYHCSVRSKTLHFYITGDFPEGYKWTAESDNSGVFFAREFKQTENEAHFILKPLDSGISGVTFTLEKAGDLPDRIFQINCGFLLDADGAVEEAAGSYLELPGTVSGEGEGFSYSIAQLNAGALQIFVRGDGVWNCERVGTRVGLNGFPQKECMLMDTDEEETLHEVTVSGGDYEGDGTLYIDSGDRHIELAYHCTGEGEISLTEHRLGTGERPVSDSDVFEQQYGLTEKLDYLIGEESVDRWRSRKDNKTEYPVGVIAFEYLGDWKLYVSREAGEADFVGKAKAAGQITEAGITANIYEDDAGVRSAWRAGKLNCMLECAEKDRALCENLTTMIMSSLAD